MRYRITRICWNDKTYNGYTDSPYWRIEFNGYDIGLTDEGQFWDISNSHFNIDTPHIRETIETIIAECKLPIKLK